MRLILAISLLLCAHGLSAQVLPETVLSPADKSVIAQIKAAKQHVRAVERLEKEITQMRKTLRKDSVEYRRTLVKIAKDSLRKLSPGIRDTLDVKVFLSTYGQNLYVSRHLPAKVREQLSQLQVSRSKYEGYIGLLDSARHVKVPDIDSLTSMLSRTAEKSAERYLKKYEKQLSKGKGDHLSNLHTAVDPSSIEGSSELKNVSIPRSTRVLKDHLTSQADKIASIESQLAKYQKKYSHVQSAKNLMADPPNPLHDKTFRERLFGGMNFSLLKGEAVTIDLSPFMGYRMDLHFSSGIALVYRLNFYSQKRFQIQEVTNDAYGLRVFTEYKSRSGLMGYAELEQARRRLDDLTGDEAMTIWLPGLYLGGGKVFKLSKRLKGQLLILYNFLQNQHSLMPKAFSFRMGIRIQ